MRFNLIYVALETPELALERVRHRVNLGGHPVPERKVVERFYRSLDNLVVFAAQADEFRVFDNSDSSNVGPPLLAIQGTKGMVTAIDVACSPALANRFIPLIPDSTGDPSPERLPI